MKFGRVHVWWVAVTGLSLVIAALFGCGPPSKAPAESAAVRTVQDSTGRRVAIPAQPQRVLSLCTSVTDTMARLSLLDRLAAMDEYSGIVPGTSNITVLAKGSALAREQVLARGLDLAFVWWYQDDAAKLLDECRVPVVRIRSGRVGEIPEMLRLVGRCLDRSNAADELAAGVLAKISPVDTHNIAVRPAVYLEMYGPFKTVGRDSYLNDLLELAGGRNIAAEKTGSVLLSAEHLLSADPEIILLVKGFADADSFSRRPGLDQLSAVHRGRVHVIDRYWLVAGAGLPESAAKLRQLISPLIQK